MFSWCALSLNINNDPDVLCRLQHLSQTCHVQHILVSHKGGKSELYYT